MKKGVVKKNKQTSDERMGLFKEMKKLSFF